jgi:toxin CcdB
MAQFDIHVLPGTDGYVVDIQSDLLNHLNTRVIAPLLPAAGVPPSIRSLHPVFDLDGRPLVLAIHLLSAVPMRELGARRGSIANRRDDVVRAIDALLIGV